MENTNEKAKGVDPKIWILLLLPILMIGLVVFLFFYFSGNFDKVENLSQETSEEKDGVAVGNDLEGEVYLTLSPSNLLPEENKSDIYKLDLATSELEPLFNEHENINYMGGFSPDLKKMVFVRAYEDDTSQILILDDQTQEISEVTSSSNFFFRNPVFSPDGTKIAYWVYENEDNPWGVGLEAEENSIYLTSLDGISEKIANGVYPIFVAEQDAMIFMKNDGLYYFDLETGVEELMIKLFVEDSPIVLPDYDPWGWAGLRVSYSQNDDVLLITDHVNEKFHIFELKSLKPFEYITMESVDAKSPNWPVFHPEGNYFLIQELKEGESLLSLSFFELDDDTPKLVDDFSLEGYIAGYIWSVDWIVR